MGDLLVKARVIDELQLRSALAQQDQWGGRLSRIVAELGLAKEDVITTAITQGLNMQRVSLGNITKDPAALAKVDVTLAEQKGIFPVSLKDGGKTLVLAMADPTDLSTIDQVAAKSRARIVPMVAGEYEIETAILRHYRNQEPSASMATRFNPTPKKDAGSDSDFNQGDDDDFKIVDMSGKTVMKRLSDIVDPNAATAAPPAAPPPPAAAAPPPPPAPSSSASDLLDEILSGGGGSAPAGFSEEEMQRLLSVQANQEKSSKILRALLELLFEKGAMQQKELASRMKM